MKFDLSCLIPALEGWIVCVDECDDICTICINLPEWVRELEEREKIYLSLYIFARAVMDYRVVSALHIYSIRNRVMLRPEILSKALRETKVSLKIPRVIEGEDPYAWTAVLYKGMAYAQSILDLDKPVVLKIKPPKDKCEREKLRVLLEGKRVTVKGKTYHVGGLIKKFNGEKIAPWIYLVPKRTVPEVISILNKAQVLTVLYSI